MNIAPLGREATLEDLWDIEGRVELIDGEIVPVTPAGQRPVRAAARIWRSLDDYEALHGGGFAVSEGAPFVLRTPRNQLFSPDAAWSTHESIVPGRIEKAPAFAAEVRSESDYGLTAEREIANKRAHYFAGGTLVVWDVDVLRERLIRVYRADDPENPTVFYPGETADAEPAVPGWRFPVDELFR